MRKILFILIILTFLVCISFVISGEETPWRPWLDGYQWTEIDDQLYKLGYLQGLLHGNLLTGRECIAYLREKGIMTEDQMWEMINSEDEWSDFYSLGIRSTYDQMIEGIDELYKDYANKKIPVHCLAALVCKRVRGLLSNENLEQELQKLRQKKEYQK